MAKHRKSQSFWGSEKETSEQTNRGARSYFEREMGTNTDWHDTDSIQFILLSCRRHRTLHSH